jgi:phenylpropionate dioxygenase-like ring-hydroxylating dioxygenase large terminal subunit
VNGCAEYWAFLVVLTPRDSDWTYINEELFELEAEELFRKHWQIACHTSDIPKQGSYITFDLVGERALIIQC